MVNICTGSIFCDFYPKLRIILMIPDRLLVDIGEFINFKATYFFLMDAFIIFEFESAKRFPRRFILNYRGFLVIIIIKTILKKNLFIFIYLKILV